MQIELRHQPSFAVARVLLNPGETFQAESGAMMAHSAGVQVSAQARGGVMKSLMRATLGGESLFISTFTADPATPGWVDLAANLPGDAQIIQVSDQQPWIITRGCWLANASQVTLDTSWGGAKMLFGGEGAFVIQATGVGPVVVSAYGALDVMNLGQGQSLTIDSGHLVAYTLGAQVQTRKVTKGVMQTLKSGEGLVMDIAGPAQVITQSRNPQALISWISSLLPSRS
jgi:uncharacterized protein (TIGR00266 family)